MFDDVIIEGLAAAFTIEVSDYKSSIAKMYDDRVEAAKIYKIVEPYFDVPENDYDKYPFQYLWPYGGDKNYDLPRNAGYILGYYIVSKYLQENAITASEAIKDNIPAKKFKDCFASR